MSPLNSVFVVVVLISILSVEMGMGLKCYTGSKGVAKKETDCDDDVKNCKTYTTSKTCLLYTSDAADE